VTDVAVVRSGQEVAPLSYGRSVLLGGTVDDVIPEVRDALKAQGFGVLTEIDVKATMKEKLDAEVAPYVILGACNPRLAHRALTAEPGIGLLLPCNVIVREHDADRVEVSAIDPQVMADLVDHPEVASVAEEAAELIDAALDALERV
jgi:uncharacterized protein (DUF302 family)